MGRAKRGELAQRNAPPAGCRFSPSAAARRVRHSPRTSAPGTLLVLPPLGASVAAHVLACDPRCPRHLPLSLALPKLHLSFSAAAMTPALTPPCLLRRAGADRMASLQVHREALLLAVFQMVPPLALTPCRRCLPMTPFGALAFQPPGSTAPRPFAGPPWLLTTFLLEHQFALSFQADL